MDIKDYIDAHSTGKKSAAKCLAFYKTLVIIVTGKTDYNDASFLIDRVDTVLKYLNTKSITTRNRYATHILSLFDFIEYDDADVFERSRAVYRDIVKETKRSMRIQEKKNEEDINDIEGTSTNSMSLAG
jgi:hypothetical protein